MATGRAEGVGNSAPPASAVQALRSATELMSEDQFSRALALGSAAGKLPGCEPLAASLATLRLVCRVHIGSSQSRTTAWQILGLDEGATSANIRRAFRKGAQRIHPDKCDLPGAEVAFKLLAAAADTALAAEPESASPNSVAASRELSSEKAPASDSSWWDEWDPTPAERRQQKRAEKRQRSASYTTAAAAILDADWLSSLSTKELKGEVARRQAAVLQPFPDSEEAAMEPLARQSRLREARALLSDKVKADKAQQLAATAGGFFNDALPGFSSDP